MTAASSFYRRALPAALLEFASPEGRVLFREALAAAQRQLHFHTWQLRQLMPDHKGPPVSP